MNALNVVHTIPGSNMDVRVVTRDDYRPFETVQYQVQYEYSKKNDLWRHCMDRSSYVYRTDNLSNAKRFAQRVHDRNHGE